MDLYSNYKPIRNYLRRTDLISSLLAIHAHLQYQGFGVALPQYIIGEPNGYRSANKMMDFVSFHLMPWELALLAKELIINSESSEHTFLKWGDLSNAVNKVKAFEEYLSSVFIDKTNVLLEITLKLAHREFVWQRRPDLDLLTRYYVIYSDPRLKPIVERCIGITIEELLKIGLSTLGLYLDKFALYYPPQIEIDGIDKGKIDKFFKFTSADLGTIKERLTKDQSFDDKYAYNYNYLIERPLIRTNYEGRDSLVCPIPRYLYERFTSGIYYEIYKDKDFDNSFGLAFQDYIGSLLKKSCKLFTVFGEERYGNSKDSVDWIAEDNSAVLFIECKTKRLTLGAKIGSVDEFKREISKLADMVVKLYKTMGDYINNKYITAKYTDKKIFPLLITLEDWFFFGDILHDALKIEVDKLMVSEDPSLKELITKYPYSVISCNTAEQLFPLVNDNGINKVLSPKFSDHESETWEMDNYLKSKYPEIMGTYKNPFSGEMDAFFDKIGAK